MARLEAWPVPGLPEVGPGDLGALLGPAVTGAGARDGDVVVVTSKVVSKAEGRMHPGERAEAVAAETSASWPGVARPASSRTPSAW